MNTLNTFSRLICSSLILSVLLFGAACAKPSPEAAGESKQEVLAPVPSEDPDVPTHTP